MKINRILVTGDDAWIGRHHGLFDCLSQRVTHLDYLPISEVYRGGFLKIVSFLQSILYRIVSKFSVNAAERIFRKNKQAFITKTKQTELKISHLAEHPDLVFHVFAAYSPFWEKSSIPYVMYLDYTMVLAVKNWTDWAPFTNKRQLLDWQECEDRVYQRASHLFTFNNVTYNSLVLDYRVDPQKITIIGSAGNIKYHAEEKQFGNQQILFNASDFKRKGGDLVLSAFQQVKKALPNAKLVIIGKKIPNLPPEVINPGKISSREKLHEIFLQTDIVLAPSYCDPFPTFVLEAMSYGIPCIVTDRDGMPEIVDHQVNGIVISEINPNVLASEVIGLLTDIPLLSSFSQAAKYKIDTKFNWNKIANKVLDTLENTLLS